MKKIIAACVAAAALALACTDVTGSANSVLSIQFDTLASPSVVIGDSLRDSTGALALPHVRAYNFEGAVVATPRVRYSAANRGVTVDSVTGVIRGDSLRATPVRIIATVGDIQAQQLLAVTLRPDSMFATAARDTILYSLLDSTLNLSKALTVSLRHGKTGADSAVATYLVSFSIVSASSAAIADLVDDIGRKSRVDTTDGGGLAGRRIRLHATAPAFVANASDSIILSATAKYRGAIVKGGPVRLVVVFKPRNP
ncbi:MAG: hypothetical protein M3Z17_07785 [Gemmatimonadota bacterium]|nr:hypothetical protein [Gemmatimonadota bacterium]